MRTGHRWSTNNETINDYERSYRANSWICYLYYLFEIYLVSENQAEISGAQDGSEILVDHVNSLVGV